MSASIPVRIAASMFGTFIIGYVSKYFPRMEYNSQQQILEDERNKNAKYNESSADRSRREECGKFKQHVEIRMYDDPMYRNILDLPLNKVLTKKDIDRAFRNQLKIYHPDIYNGNNNKVIKIISARDALLEELQMATLVQEM